ncbi:MAG TPA: DUF6526 family protein [Ferruginibacter sp.]|nr:DUF6526 family protein [Ferruginibacter sp.]
METQQFSNHVKKHPLFHQFIVPVSLLLVAASLTNIVLAFSLQALILLITTILLHLIAFIARDYAKKNQDRIIRAEMRLRYYLLTGESFERKEQQLSNGQVAALRFAEDEELLSLLEDQRTYARTPTEIKTHIKNWKPDHMRV